MKGVFGAKEGKEPSPSVQDASDRTFNLDQVSSAAEGIKDAQQTSLQDEMIDVKDVSSEIEESFGRSYNVPDGIEEVEVLDELEALEAAGRGFESEELEALEAAGRGFESEGGMPSYLQPDKESDLDGELSFPSAPTGHAPIPAGRANVQAEDELGLPAVPGASLRN